MLGALAAAVPAVAQTPRVVAGGDSDDDGKPDACDSCPEVTYLPGFDHGTCGPMDLDPSNDPDPECKARERVALYLLTEPAFITHIAFSVVKDGEVWFADAFEYVGAGQFVHDPAGVHRLHRIGSTTKSMTAVAAKILEEGGTLSFADHVDDDDATQELVGGQRTLRDLLTHQGAFELDSGHIYTFCYPGGLAAFWAEASDDVSPHYDSPNYGNLGGGYAYSAFNYSLAGAYLSNRAGLSFEHVLQTSLFDPAGICTATLDGPRAVASPIGDAPGISETALMHTGPYINLVSPGDPLCVDNYYSSDDVYGDNYSWQPYWLDEATAEPRDPAGGVMASVVDMAHFATVLLGAYRGTSPVLSQAGVIDLWTPSHDFGCTDDCPYQRYYGVGFFTDTPAGQPITEVEHGGGRAGFNSVFVVRPEANTAVSILVNGNVASLVAMNALAKDILDDF